MIGAHEAPRLVALQAVPLGRGEDHFLVLACKLAERVGERRPNAPVSELFLNSIREARAESHSSLDPRRLMVQKPRDGFARELVLLEERADDPRFVERRDRSLG